MTVSLICGGLLWVRRREAHDRSRFFLSLFCLFVVVKLAAFLIGNMGDYLSEFSHVLFSPQLTVGGLFSISLFICYPIEVLHPRQLRGWWIALLFVPSIAALLLIYIIPFRELHTWDDFWMYLGDFDVLLRVVCVFLVAVISLLLLLIPYNWHHSSADHRWIRHATLIAQILSIFFYLHTFTHSLVLNLLHVLWGTYAILHFTYYELFIRILPPMDDESDADKYLLEEAYQHKAETDDAFWRGICKVMDECEVWRNPDASVDMVSQIVGTNRLYLARSIREHTGLTFNDYMNKKRIDYMVAQLRLDPQQDHKQLYFIAGFRSRTSAYRNFVKFMGCSPTVFVSTL